MPAIPVTVGPPSTNSDTLEATELVEKRFSRQVLCCIWQSSGWMTFVSVTIYSLIIDFPEIHKKMDLSVGFFLKNGTCVFAVLWWSHICASKPAGRLSVLSGGSALVGCGCKQICHLWIWASPRTLCSSHTELLCLVKFCIYKPEYFLLFAFQLVWAAFQSK